MPLLFVATFPSVSYKCHCTTLDSIWTHYLGKTEIPPKETELKAIRESSSFILKSVKYIDVFPSEGCISQL